MSELRHTHESSTDKAQQRAHNRFPGVIQTRNFRLSRTQGTRTRYTLMDRRTAWEIEFDHVSIGVSIGRGDTIQFFVGDVDHEKDRPHIGMTRVGDVYQHDVDDEILEALEHIEEYHEFPTPDYVVDGGVLADE